MAIKYNFPLPGNAPAGLGKRLFLLGTSEDGPYMEPVLVQGKKQARRIFGQEGKGNLVKAFDEAYDRYEDISIYLMRITGKSATLDIEGIESLNFDDPQYCLSLRSYYAGEAYNDTSVHIGYDGSKQLNTFYLATSTDLFAYELQAEETIGSLIQRINNDARRGVHHIMASTDFPQHDIGPLEFALSDAPLFLEGGDDGLAATKNDLYLECDLAYEILLGRAVDVIVPVGMYVDDVHPALMYGSGTYGNAMYASTLDYLQLLDAFHGNKVVTFHEQLIDFCRKQMQLGYMTHGIIGLRPYDELPNDVERGDSYLNRLLTETAFKNRYGFVEYRNGQWHDKGYYVSIVPMELVFRDGQPDAYHANAAVRYAAIAANHFGPTTSVSLGDDVSLRYELSNDTMSELTRLGVVVFRDSVRHGLVIHSGVTAAHTSSEMHSFANVRMVQVTLAYMNEATHLVYESHYDHDMRRTYLEQLIKDRVDMLVAAGILTGYEYAIRFSGDHQYNEIHLTLQTKYTVEGIAAIAEIARQEALSV